MKCNIDKSTVTKSLITYGKDIQTMVCVEELGELIQAISKANRYSEEGYRVDVIEEMADVLICIETLKEIYGITNAQIQAWIDFKIERQQQRLSEVEK